MKSFILLSFFIIAALPASAQPDSIQFQDNPANFYLKGEKQSPKELLEITKSNPVAYQEMKIARSNLIAGNIIGGVGGFLVGWPLGTSFAGGDPNWTLAIVGGGLIVASIPFARFYTKRAKKAVRIYNRGLEPTSYQSIQLDLNLQPTELGLRLRF